jgi:hypothetical protein
MLCSIALMQPYIFPYIGYFQLIRAVDRFIVYDDVTFIKQGWINRNRLLANGAPLFFSIPLSGAGSHTLIREAQINNKLYASWRIKFFKTLEQYYRKAPQYEQVLPMIKDVLAGEPQLISDLALCSIKAVCAYLGITTKILETSVNYGNSNLKAEDRVIDICCQEGTQIYVNAAGGQHLYSRQKFSAKGIELKFLNSSNVHYQQFKLPFVPFLSIIDVLMFNTFDVLQEFIAAYDLK